jgi:hypothetical protein
LHQLPRLPLLQAPVSLLVLAVEPLPLLPPRLPLQASLLALVVPPRRLLPPRLPLLQVQPFPLLLLPPALHQMPPLLLMVLHHLLLLLPLCLAPMRLLWVLTGPSFPVYMADKQHRMSRTRKPVSKDQNFWSATG